MNVNLSKNRIMDQTMAIMSNKLVPVKPLNRPGKLFTVRYSFYDHLLGNICGEDILFMMLLC